MRRSKKKVIAREAKLRLTGQIMTECSVCKAFLPEGYHAMFQGQVYCTRCIRSLDLFICDHCHHPILMDHIQSINSRDMCDHCAKTFYSQCFHCHKYHLNEDTIPYNGYHYCKKCHDKYFTKCSECGSTHKALDGYTKEDGSKICSVCFSRSYALCNICEKVHLQSAMQKFDGLWYCLACNPRERIQAAGFKPEPTFFSTSDKDSKTFLGVELEIECEDVTASIKAFNVSEEFYLKSDGSLSNGVEIVSQPCTLDYHKSKINWSDRCKKLVTSGAKSHQTTTCGLHIHASSDRMSDLDKMKLSWFIHKEIENIRIISRRKTPYTCGGRINLKDPDLVIDDIRRGAKDSPSTCYRNPDRYAYLNWHNRHTVEFRLPKGTLNAETLVATIELCDAAIEYTACKTFGEIRTGDFNTFLSWCQSSKRNRERYSNLIAFFMKKDRCNVPINLQKSRTALEVFMKNKEIKPEINPVLTEVGETETPEHCRL